MNQFTRNQKGIMPLAVAMIVVVVLVIGGSVAYYLLNFRVCCLPIQNNVNTNQNINSAQITGWKTYVNAKFGFSLQHPSSLTPFDEDDRVDFGGRTIPDATFTVETFKPKIVRTDQKLDEYLTVVAQERLKSDYVMEIVSFHNGGLEVDVDGLFPRVFFLFDESSGIFAQFFAGIEYFSSDEFKQIVSSFIFSNQITSNLNNTNKNLNNNWLTRTLYYNGIEIFFEYPPQWLENTVDSSSNEDSSNIAIEIRSPLGNQFLVFPDGGFGYGLDEGLTENQLTIEINGFRALKHEFFYPDGFVLTRIEFENIPNHPNFRVEFRMKNATEKQMLEQMLNSLILTETLQDMF